MPGNRAKKWKAKGTNAELVALQRFEPEKGALGQHGGDPVAPAEAAVFPC